MPEEGPSEERDYVHRRGAPYGFRQSHLAIGLAILVVWFGVLAFVLTHGRNQGSSVDVYSELPPGFTGSLQQHGVTYQGLSPVDAATQSAALSHVPALGSDSRGTPIVLRTSFTTSKGVGQPGVATQAIMVVVPDPTGSDVRVDFLDPTSFTELKSVEYAATGPGGAASSGP